MSGQYTAAPLPGLSLGVSSEHVPPAPGEMLLQSWEPLATQLASCGDEHSVAALVQQLLATGGGAAPTPPAGRVCVLLGHDTRPSAPDMLAAAHAGVRSLGVQPLSLGLVTTPQLHFIVHAFNNDTASSPSGTAAAAIADAAASSAPPHPGPSSPTASNPSRSPELVHPRAVQHPPSPDLYLDSIIPPFLQLLQLLPPPPPASSPPAATAYAAGPLHVDCAHGVGAILFSKAWPRLAGTGLQLELRNRGAAEAGCSGSSGGGGGLLNHCVGADHVQKERVAPLGFEDLGPNERCVWGGGQRGRGGGGARRGRAGS